MEIHFRIGTLVISKDRFRVVLAQVIFRPTRATVLAKGFFRELSKSLTGWVYSSERELPRCPCSQVVCGRTVLVRYLLKLICGWSALLSPLVSRFRWLCPPALYSPAPSSI